MLVLYLIDITYKNDIMFEDKTKIHYINIKERYKAMSEIFYNKNNIKEILEMVRSLDPTSKNAILEIYKLKTQTIADDSKVRLEIACKFPNEYHGFEIFDAILEETEDTELMRRLFEANKEEYGHFIASSVFDQEFLKELYNSNVEFVNLAVADNENTGKDLLETIIAETTDEKVKNLAVENLKRISST